MEDAYFKIGYISKTHGLKGGVTAVFSKDSPPLDEIKTIFIEVSGNLVPYELAEYSDRTDKAFLRFEDVTTPEAATLLRGCSLFAPKKERPKLTKGEFYDDEVVGYDVEDVNLGPLGVVKEILQMGPNRLLSVLGNSKEVLIPIHGPFITAVNKSKKKFTVDLPDGFLEI